MRRDPQGEYHLMMGPEIERMHVKTKYAKDCRQHQKLGENMEQIFPYSLQKKHGLTNTLILDFQSAIL